MNDVQYFVYYQLLHKLTLQRSSIMNTLRKNVISLYGIILIMLILFVNSCKLFFPEDDDDKEEENYE